MDKFDKIKLEVEALPDGEIKTAGKALLKNLADCYKLEAEYKALKSGEKVELSESLRDFFNDSK